MRRLRVGATATTDMAFGVVKGSGTTLRVPVRVADMKMKSCRTLIIQPSAGDVCLWTAVKAHHCGAGKYQLFVQKTFT